MASNSETGHKVNLENYRILGEEIGALGAYNPVTEKIKKTVMAAQWTAGNALHEALTDLLADCEIPVNERETLFDTMKDRVRRSLNLYKSTDAPRSNVRDAKRWADKITGANVRVKKLEDGTPDPKSVSTSQQSYTMRAEHFTQFIKLLKNDSNYATNETILTTVSLEALLNDINSKNTQIYDLIAAIKIKRFERNMSLYLLETGIIDVALACKQYVRGVYGASSQEAKNIGKIQFRRFMKLKETGAEDVVEP